MTRRRLITERDVVRAARDGHRDVDGTGAMVTPAARDAAGRLGVTIASSPARAATPTGGGTASTGATSASTGGVAASTGAAPATTPHTPAGTLTRIVLGADHGGVALKDTLIAVLRDRGYTVSDVGTFGAAAVDYPDFAVAVAQAVAEGRADAGIMIDGAGIGSCMAANRIAGVRAAMCHDVTTAVNAREHNNANVLTLGGGLLGPRLAEEIVRTFLATPFAGGRHQRRVDKIDALLPPRPRS